MVKLTVTPLTLSVVNLMLLLEEVISTLSDPFRTSIQVMHFPSSNIVKTVSLNALSLPAEERLRLVKKTRMPETCSQFPLLPWNCQNSLPGDGQDLHNVVQLHHDS